MAFGQAQNIDSLLRIVKQAKNDKQTCISLLNYADALKRTDIDSAIRCSSTSLVLATNLKNDSLAAEANTLLGYCCEVKGNYKNALVHFLKAIEVFKSQKNKNKLSTCYNGMGIVYWYQGFYDKAIEYYKKNTDISREINDKNGLATSYGNMAIIFDEKGDLDNSLLHYKKALVIFEEEQNLPSMASCYDNMSLVFKQKKDFKQALDYNNKSYKVRDELHHRIFLI